MFVLPFMVNKDVYRWSETKNKHTIKAECTLGLGINAN